MFLASVLRQTGHLCGNCVLSDEIATSKFGWQPGQTISLQRLLVNSAILFHSFFKNDFLISKTRATQIMKPDGFCRLGCVLREYLLVNWRKTPGFGSWPHLQIETSRPTKRRLCLQNAPSLPISSSHVESCLVLSLSPLSYSSLAAYPKYPASCHHPHVSRGFLFTLFLTASMALLIQTKRFSSWIGFGEFVCFLGFFSTH